MLLVVLLVLVVVIAGDAGGFVSAGTSCCGFSYWFC